MRKLHAKVSFSFLSMCSGAVAILAVSYIGLIAVVMSYAALTVSFSQSLKNDEASVATLESQYLVAVANVQSVDYQALGYVVPKVQSFVPAQSVTALR